MYSFHFVVRVTEGKRDTNSSSLFYFILSICDVKLVFFSCSFLLLFFSSFLRLFSLLAKKTNERYLRANIKIFSLFNRRKRNVDVGENVPLKETITVRHLTITNTMPERVVLIYEIIALANELRIFLN